MTCNPPETEVALDLLYEFLVTAMLARHGIPNSPEELQFVAPTYADMEILPGDLKLLTGFGQKDY